jgi:hypothetical protein
MNILLLILTGVIFLGSFPVMSFAFQVPGFEAVIFAIGILMSVFAWMIPMYIIPRITK